MSVKPESFAMKTMFSFTGFGKKNMASRSGGGGPPSPRHLSGTKLANLGPGYHIPDRSQKDPQSKSGRGFCCWETRGTGDRDFAAGGEEARRSGRGAHLAGLSLES